MRLEAIMLETIAIRFQAIASRLEAITVRFLEVSHCLSWKELPFDALGYLKYLCD